MRERGRGRFSLEFQERIYLLGKAAAKVCESLWQALAGGMDDRYGSTPINVLGLKRPFGQIAGCALQAFLKFGVE